MLITLPRSLSVTRSCWVPLLGLPLIPLWRTLRFPDGRYELEPGSGQIRWRYLGPHLSTHGRYVERRNADGSGTSTPVGFKGPWEFGGQWVGDGQLLNGDGAALGLQAWRDFERLFTTGHQAQALAMLVELEI